MPAARPLPEPGSVLLDARGGGRALRVSWHLDAGLVVLSLWRDNVCAGSFRLTGEEVPGLIATLQAGLDAVGDGGPDERADEAEPTLAGPAAVRVS